MRILLWAVQLDPWKSISTQLSPGRHRRRLHHPLQRSGGCNTITQVKEVSWTWQHHSRTDQSWWRGHNHHSHDNLQQDLTDRRMANPVDPVLGRHTSQDWSCHGDHSWRTGRLQSRKEYHKEDLQPIWENYLQHQQNLYHVFIDFKGLRQGLTCSFWGNHEEVQHQHKPYPNHQKPL